MLFYLFFLLLFYFSHPPNVTTLQAIKKAINILSNIQTLKLTITLIYYPLLHIIHQMSSLLYFQFHLYYILLHITDYYDRCLDDGWWVTGQWRGQMAGSQRWSHSRCSFPRLTDYNTHSIRCRSSFILCVVQIKSNSTLLNISLWRRQFPMRLKEDTWKTNSDRI